MYALLFHGLENEVLDGQLDSNRISEMERVAESTFVRLEAARDSERLVLVEN